MKRILMPALIWLATIPVFSQKILSIEECRKQALEHNKSIQIATENVKVAGELRKAVFTQFLPNFSMNGSYTWNQKNLSLLSEDALLPVGVKNADGSFGTGITATSTPTPNADGTFSFNQSAISNKFAYTNGTMVPLDANGTPFNPTTNPEKLLWKNYAILPKEAMEFDIHNIFAGSISFIQPVFMGGKIVELYKIAKSGEKLAKTTQDNKITELLIDVDEAYWRVVSLQNKVNLANEYCKLLEKMHTDVMIMIEEGVATKADELKVNVKLNEAEVMATKAENGLNLSKMALCQLCGMSFDTEFTLTDQDLNSDITTPELIPIEQALNNRPEIKSLMELENIAKSNEKIAFSRFLPTIGVTGNYLVSNPNTYNGYANEFGGMFSFGVVAHVPLFHFGENLHTLNVTKSQSKIANMQVDEAKEKIQLQIKQNSYKVAESIKKEKATQKNSEKAEENLKCANEGFKEGIITSSDLLGAQIAWLTAKSENLDAKIDIRLNNLYFSQSLGTIVCPDNITKTTK